MPLWPVHTHERVVVHEITFNFHVVTAIAGSNCFEQIYFNEIYHENSLISNQ